MVAVMDKATYVPVSTAPFLRTGGGRAPGIAFPRRILVAIGPERDAETALSAATALAAAHVPATIRVRTTLDWGSHVGGLLHAERRERPDLIVVRSAYEGVRVLDHHRTHGLLRHARVPVLVVPVGR